ncbi:MAG: glycosyltransferase family 4 protein [bacterium]|nr:glycosyltransferase family 4 protein [bacterium]
MQKNVLIVADVYPPEVSSASHLMSELANGLKKRGHNVFVATAYPRHYLVEKSSQEDFPVLADENGIKVLRIKILPNHKVSFFVRGLSQLTLPWLFSRAIRKNIPEKIDSVFVYSPPLPMGLVGIMVKKRFGAKLILNLQDIFPQNAIDLGILKNRLIISFFEKLEKRIYRQADLITFNSEGGRRFLIEKKGILENRIITLFNWVDLNPYDDLGCDISFRKQWGLDGKFVFLFAGIMGPAQGLDFIVEVAKSIVDLKEAVFLLVGEGMEKEKTRKMAEKYNLSNIIFKPFVSKEEYPCLVKAADVGLVCLSIKNKTPFLPGKFLGYLAAQKPVLAFLNKESDGFSLIDEAICGRAVLAGNKEEAVLAIRQFIEDQKRTTSLGINGRRYLESHFAAEVIFDKIEKIL